MCRLPLDSINTDRIALVADCAAYLPYSLRMDGMQAVLPVPPQTVRGLDKPKYVRSV